MTTITKLRKSYQNKTLPKPYFLGAIFAQLQALVEIQEALNNTQIDEIVINKDFLRIRTVDLGLELLFHPEEANSLVTGILAFGDAERMERKALLTVARHSSTILDIGANIGWYSLHFARVAPKARIHAFEPAAKIHERLLANLSLNGINSVVTEKLALQHKEGTATLFFHPAETGATSMRDNRGFTGVQNEEITCSTLDHYCALHELSPELIKCDVEGGELSVIKGGLTTLQTHHPVVFMELLRKWSANFGYHPNEVIEIMRDIGYTTWAIDSSGISKCDDITEETLATNFLFMHEGKHTALITQLEHL